MQERSSISCGTDLTIQQVESLKPRFVAALEKDAKQYTINVSKVEKVDSTGVQLLCSFIKSISDQGHSFTFQQPSEAFLSACKLLGMIQNLQLEQFTGDNP